MATASSRAPAAKLAGGRWEFRSAGGDVLVLADPPEAGWRLLSAGEKRSHSKVASGARG
jgi:hypothetical protein